MLFGASKQWLNAKITIHLFLFYQDFALRRGLSELQITFNDIKLIKQLVHRVL